MNLELFLTDKLIPVPTYYEMYKFLYAKYHCLYKLFIFLFHRLPSEIKKIFHPIICCALSADLAAIAYGTVSQSGVDAVLGLFLSHSHPNSCRAAIFHIYPFVLSLFSFY